VAIAGRGQMQQRRKRYQTKIKEITNNEQIKLDNSVGVW
jgi:hypothetical protein